jgi:hypothetical protein
MEDNIVDTEVHNEETYTMIDSDDSDNNMEGNEASTGEQAISEGYNKMYKELVEERGYSARRARRYLDSIAKRRVKKFVKTHKKNIG